MTSAAKSQVHGQDSPVMSETLSVIDEHITDMNSPHKSVVVDRRPTNDSSSDYSTQVDPRLSYINGEETDEEEDAIHTRDEVLTWTSDQVAEYLFTAGVEAQHCEVFRDQEITGDVLLGMDQTTVFLKEFDLGSVGRRLKTWQKIKTLQDEVNGELSTRRNTATYGSDVSSDDVGRNRSRSETSTMASTTMLPRIPSLMDRPTSGQNTRPQHHISRSSTVKQPPASPKSAQSSPRKAGDKRPSAASIRDFHHSRQSSANEFSTASFRTTLVGDAGASSKLQDGHKKEPSFDRNWTMGGASSPPLSTAITGRPSSSSGLGGFNAIAGDSTDHQPPEIPGPTFDTLDRGYFSGGEAEGRLRNVLKKKAGSTTHSRNSSYTDEQRMRSATSHSRHSRFGSVDSIRDPNPPSAAQKYYGLTGRNRRTPSEGSINAPRPVPPPKDSPTPAVTKLGGTPYEKTTAPKSPVSRHGNAPDWLLPKPATMSRHFGLRAISDAITSHEKSKVTTPIDTHPNSVKESPVHSPSTRTGSSTASGGPSFDLDSPDGKHSSSMATPGAARTPAKRKTKKETSAYTRGLEKKTPQEQMVGADYSGWMKKKSSNLMATWKPRLFVLKGRRLSYYYSEDDTEERGLIDISFHKVLPADNERLTGLHATITGATTSPNIPAGAHETIAGKEAAAQPESTLSKASGDSMFIFKLQPPKAGLARAVNFTKPTVHYFAVPNVAIGRLWMAALVKATIDRDDSAPVVTTYQQKTISLEKARRMRHRPPALMNLDEHVDEEAMKTPASDKNGLNIQGIIFDGESHEGDSGVSGLSKPDEAKPEIAGLSNGHAGGGTEHAGDGDETKTA